MERYYLRHTDSDGDELDVKDPHSELGRHRGSLLFALHPEGDRDETRSVALNRDAVLRLYSALGEWLYPVHTPEGPNRSLIEELIAKAVKDQVAAILPLHLAPKPFVPFTSCTCHDSEGHSILPDPDPEPHDVGHVEAPRPCDASMRPGERLSDVHEACGFLWALHKVIPPADAPQGRCEGCRSGNHPHVFRPCEKPGCGCRETVPEPEHGRLMTELPRRTRPRTAPKCLDCLHGWGEHTGGICWGTGGHDNLGNGCRCTRERPGAALLRKQMQEEAAPPPCTECGHPYLSHGDECAAILRDDHAIKCGCTRYRSTR